MAGINLGLSALNSVNLGSSEVAKVYLGTALVYSSTPIQTTTPLIFNHTYNAGLGIHDWYVRSKDTNTSEMWSEFDNITPELNHVTGMELNDETGQESSAQVHTGGTVYAKALATDKTLSDYDSSYNAG